MSRPNENKSERPSRPELAVPQTSAVSVPPEDGSPVLSVRPTGWNPEELLSAAGEKFSRLSGPEGGGLLTSRERAIRSAMLRHPGLTRDAAEKFMDSLGD